MPSANSDPHPARSPVHPALETFSHPTPMLHYAVVFLIIAILAAVFGFTGAAGTAAWIAQVLFVLFLVLFVVSLVTGRRPSA